MCENLRKFGRIGIQAPRPKYPIKPFETEQIINNSYNYQKTIRPNIT
jgi:hypothetical protein